LNNMADLATIKRTVAELEARGDINKAISELQEAIKEFPKEGSLFNKLGDLYMKLGRQKEAVEVYEKGVYVLKEETYFPNAIALCKKILRIDKDRTEIYGVLGELHREIGQLVEAANYLLEYAERKMKSNEIDTALKTYETIKNLVPNNYKILQTISAIYEKFGKKEESAGIKREAEIIEAKQKELKESLIVKPPQEIPKEVPVPESVPEKVPVPESLPEAPVVEEKVEEEKPEEKPGANLSIDDLVSPEVAELLKTETPSFKETEVIETPQEVEISRKEISEIDRTRELGEVYLNLGEEEEAINCFRNAATMAYKEKNYEQAIYLNKRVAELRPLDLKSRQYLVEIAKLMGDKKMQVEALLELAQALNRREAKTEAQSIFRKVLEIDPNNVTALKMVEEVIKPQEFIDLGAILKTEIEGGKTEGLMSIDKLISEFRKEVFESIGEGDYRSHYDLGVAYKGMGLYQEAIEEFEIASKDENLKLKACEMIGSCLIDKGRLEEAIKVLTQGLAIPNRPPAEYFGIHFLLGNIYERQNNLSMAIKSYMNAANIDKTVPELAKKIAELKEKLTEELKRRGKVVPPQKPVEEKTAGPEKAPQKKSKVTYL